MRRAEQIRRLRQVLERKLEEQLLPRFSLRELAPDGVIIVAAVLDGVVEDRRVRRQAGDGQFIDIAAQRAGPQQVARDVVEPEALPQVVHDSTGVHDITSIAAPGLSLERDDVSSNRHPALAYWWSMIFSKNRYPLFGIML